MTPQAFLNTLYSGAPPGWLTVWTLPDKRTEYFPVSDLDAAAAYAEARFDTHDVYYGVGVRQERLGPHQRGGNGDVSVIPALWTDIDILGPAHKETALPPTEAEALAFLKALPHKPSMVISSGNGLHVYWLFTEPIGIATDAHRDNISGALKGWQQYINRAAKERGWKLDNTSDLSRVLRIPGGVNHKTGNGVRVTVISECDARYSPSDFAAYIVREPVSAAPAASAHDPPEFTAPVGPGGRIIDKCAFIRYCRKLGSGKMISVGVCRCPQADLPSYLFCCSRSVPGYYFYFDSSSQTGSYRLGHFSPYRVGDSYDP